MTQTDDLALWREYAQVYDGLMQILPYRNLLSELASFAVALEENGHILDVGCGTGNLIEVLWTHGLNSRFTGLDSSPAMLEIAQAKASRLDYPASFIQADLNQPASIWGLKGQYDLVICNNSLYALEEPAKVVAELARFAAPGAMLVVSTPSQQPDVNAIQEEHLQLAGGPRETELARLCQILDGLHAANRKVLARYGPGSATFPTQEELEGWLDGTGWQLTGVTRTYAKQNWLLTATRRESI
jgi:2-polyprenyl-3-methyl-5-hydroxy-6-metoxy-1,4-benzoquinol methylase